MGSFPGRDRPGHEPVPDGGATVRATTNPQRSAGCDVRLPSAKVSRRHCVLADLGPCLAVRDLGSTNGTRLNGTLVWQGRLRDGDELAVGDLRYRVDADVAGAAASRREAAPSPVAGAPQEPVLDDAALELCDEPVPLGEPILPASVARFPLTGVVPPPSW